MIKPNKNEEQLQTVLGTNSGKGGSFGSSLSIQFTSWKAGQCGGHSSKPDSEKLGLRDVGDGSV
eukprot:795587-Amphidinium_carterae.1